MSFVYELIDDNTLERDEILSLEKKYNLYFRQGLFDREKKCFMLIKYDLSIMKDWDGENISVWILKIDNELIEFSKKIIFYKKINESTINSFQKIIDLKIPKNSRIDKEYILNLIVLALKEYKEVGVSYAHKITNYDLSIDVSEVQ